MPQRANGRADVALTEAAAVRALASIFGGALPAHVELGIGDDAAVIRHGRSRVAYSVDTQVEGVHFLRDWLKLQDVGFRSLNAAVSDLAAMGALPLAALSSLIVPSSMAERELRRLASGQAAAARTLDCPIVGGNLARGSELSVTTTVIGEVLRPGQRSGARPGDELWLCGAVGVAAAGLEFLQRNAQVQSAAARACVRAWRRPRALVQEGLALSRCATAMMDLSDGVAADAPRLALASGVRLVVEEPLLRAALPRVLLNACRELSLPPERLALEGGEDYALLATGPARRRPSTIMVIGRVERGNGAVWRRSDGRDDQLRGGFDHFRGQR
jgi:thiamine-monophosphate kinase